jgi:hypothetical protein
VELWTELLKSHCSDGSVHVVLSTSSGATFFGGKHPKKLRRYWCTERDEFSMQVCNTAAESLTMHSFICVKISWDTLEGSAR